MKHITVHGYAFHTPANTHEPPVLGGSPLTTVAGQSDHYSTISPFGTTFNDKQSRLLREPSPTPCTHRRLGVHGRPNGLDWSEQS